MKTHVYPTHAQEMPGSKILHAFSGAFFSTLLKPDMISFLSSRRSGPQNSIYRSLAFFFLIASNLVLANTAFGQTTYTWNQAGNGTWTTSTNWTPTRTTPAADDILVINNGGTKTISSVPTQTIGRLEVDGNTNVTFTSSGSSTVTMGNGTGDDFIIMSGSTMTIGGSNSLTFAVAASPGATADISGTLTINSGRTYNVGNSTTLTTVAGTIVNAGTISNATAARLNFASGGTYQHSQNGGTVPTSTWDVASNCNITGMTSSYPAGMGQMFGNVMFGGTNVNIESISTDLTCLGNLTMNYTSTSNHFGLVKDNTRTISVDGNFLKQGTGQLNGISGNGNLTINVDGNFTWENGTFVGKSNNGIPTITIGGNFSLTGGTMQLRNTSSGGAPVLNVAGDFSATTGTMSSNDGASSINFNGSGTQVYSSGATFSGSGGGVFNRTVNSGAFLQMAAASTVVAGPGTFVLSSGATLGITSTAGITSSGATGNIQVTGTRTFNTGASYVYNGTGGAQAGGNGLPATVSNLTIDNAAGVTLAAAKSITNNLSITTGSFINLGIFTHSAGSLTLGGAGTASGSWGSTSSPAMHTNDTYFAPTTGIVNVSTNTCMSAECSITGPDPVCPSSSGNVYEAPAGAAYSWSITGNGTINGSSSGQSVSVDAGIGCNSSFTLTLMVIEGNGCSSTCMQTVTVEDGTAPDLSGCDEELLDDTFECNGAEGNETAADTWNAANIDYLEGCATDMCGVVTVTSDYDFADLSNGCGESGAITVTYTLVDECENFITMEGTFTIEDTEAPSIDVAASDETVECDGAGNAAELAAWLADHGGAEASDDCSGVTWSYDPDPAVLSDDCGATGSVTVTFTATDNCGLSSETTATFTVEDTEAPTAVCEDITIALDVDGNASITPADVDNGSNDVCGGISMVSVEPNAFDCGNIGQNIVTLTITDECGNTAECTSTITVTGGPFFSYVIAAQKETKLDKNNVVHSGGVGVTDIGGKADIKDNSYVIAAGTFVEADNISVTGGSQVAVAIYSPAIVPLPAFQYNTQSTNSSPDVDVPDNTTQTITGSVFDAIKIGKNATAIFTSPDIYSNKFEVKENSTVRFTQCATVRTEDLKLERDNIINPDAFDVKIFSEKDVLVKEGSDVIATLYSLKEIKAQGKPDNRTSMTGIFIGEKVDGSDSVDWYANTQCDSECSLPVARISGEKADNMVIAPAEANELVAYPNPFSDNFHIMLRSSRNESMSVRVFDISGRTVSESLNVDSNKWLTIGNQLNPGVYFMEITQGDYRKVIHMIKAE